MFGFGKKEKHEPQPTRTDGQELPKKENAHPEHAAFVRVEHKKPEQAKKITRDTMIGEAAVMCPDAPEIMLSFGLHCIGCGMTAYETIEQGCMGHGMPEEIISKLIDELNEALEEYEREAANQGHNNK